MEPTQRERLTTHDSMEHFYMCLLLFLLSFSFLTFLLILYKHQSHFSAPNIPPGHVGIPFLGESLEFLSTGWKGHPEKFISDRVSRFSSQVFKTHILGAPFAVFCGAEGNKFLFSNENKLVRTWWPESVNKIFPFSTQESDATEESKKMRKFLPQFLKPEGLQKYIGIMDEIAQRHFVSEWENRDQVIVFQLAKRYTFWIACRLFLSLEDPGQVSKFEEPFQVLASGIISVPINLPGTPFNRAIKASNLVRKELLRIIQARKSDLAEGKASPKQDILSHMLTTCDDEGRLMREGDIVDKIMALLIGGHDTTSGACTFIVKYLAELPHVYDGVYTEQIEIAKSKRNGERLNWGDIQKMKYSWNVASEVLRLAPPLQGAFREATSDFIFNGFHIPKGWKLYWSANSTHREPKYFSEPEKFDPRRFEGAGPAPYTFVPFGGGPRMCPGKEYARLEILVFMHNIVKRFKWEKLLPDEKIVVNPMPTPAKGLPIHLHPHRKDSNVF